VVFGLFVFFVTSGRQARISRRLVAPSFRPPKAFCAEGAVQVPVRRTSLK
jgi:hypothetical protein